MEVKNNRNLQNSALILEKQSLFLNYFGQSALVCKEAGVKQLIYWNEFATPLSSGTKYLLATLPNDYKPVSELQKNITIIADSSNEEFPAFVTIENTGKIYLTPVGKDTKKCSCFFSFVWI